MSVTEKKSPLVLLAYTSIIQPKLAQNTLTLNTTTTNILGEANKNNQGKQLTGVLYYGQQHFFQCIEGPENTVHSLYKTIKKDDRHKSIKLLASNHISKRYFASWHMKFVDNHPEINGFLNQIGQATFAPENLTKSQLNDLIKVLQKI